jgi:hypothetical protein
MVVPPLVVLFRLADHGTDTGTCHAANNGTLQSAAEDRAEDGTTGTPDERPLTGSYPALSLLVILTEAFIVAVLLMARIVILTAVSTVAETLVEIRSRVIVPIAPIVLSLATSGAVGILAEAVAERGQ